MATGAAMEAAAAVPRVYRALRRAGVVLDSRPSLHAFLRMRNVDMVPIPLVHSNGAHGAAVAAALNRGIDAVMGQHECWRLPTGSAPHGSTSATTAQAIRRLFREGCTAEQSVPVALDAGLTALRLMAALSRTVASAQAPAPATTPPLPSTSPLLPRCGKVREAGVVAPGVALCQHPSILHPGRAVNLIYDISRNVPDIHGNDAWMLRAYTINRPVHATVAQFTRRTDLGALGDQPLFYAGRSDSHLAIIHTLADVPGAAAINEEAGCPLYIGGSLVDINKRLTEDPGLGSQMKVVLGSEVIPLHVHDPGDSGTGREPDISLPHEDQWLSLEGEGVAHLAMLPPQAPPPTCPPGTHAATMWHQHVAWSAIMHAFATHLQASSTPSAATIVRDWASLPPETFPAAAQAMAAVEPVAYFAADACSAAD